MEKCSRDFNEVLMFPFIKTVFVWEYNFVQQLIFDKHFKCHEMYSNFRFTFKVNSCLMGKNIYKII